MQSQTKKGKVGNGMEQRRAVYRDGRYQTEAKRNPGSAVENGQCRSGEAQARARAGGLAGTIQRRVESGARILLIKIRIIVLDEKGSYNDKSSVGSRPALEVRQI